MATRGQHSNGKLDSKFNREPIAPIEKAQQKKGKEHLENQN